METLLVDHPQHFDGAVTPTRLSLQNVTVEFKSKNGLLEAVRDLDLEIKAGEFVCLVGPSGCGKTTLLNILAGTIKPSHGTALINGSPILGPGPDRAVIFQEHALFPWLTAVQNVEYGLTHIKNKKDRRERALSYLHKVHLAKFANSRPFELSGGMKQRVAIARALSLEPDVLLMDEPFASLDAYTRDLLLEELQRIWLETGKTIVFVTHNVMEAVTLGDRVVCLGTRPGRIKTILNIALSRPRKLEEPETAVFARRIMDHLQEEIANIINEEFDRSITDKASYGNGGPGHGITRTPGLMGDGI